ncbi:MAG: hypothetical protein U0441_34305 [Polyangiaceae bacterium]
MALVHVTVRGWVSAFLFTQAVEIPVYVVAMRRALAQERARRPRGLPLQLAVAFGASAITHPIVWFVISGLAPSFQDPGPAYIEYVVRAESFALIVEAFYFYLACAISFRRALVWSLLANGLSAGLGFTSRAIFHWP